jgi:ubiquinone/menaquinone biosynthesis C-methylase UbiE
MADVTPLDNYASPENLQARISIHGYAVNPDWTSWLFEREFPTDATGLRVLELGCGTGALWAANLERVDPSWSLTFADSSDGMLKTARVPLGNRAEYALADAEALPFPDAAFDVVVVNHMLYHVPDRPRAFGEIQRVRAPAGAFHCSTNGRVIWLSSPHLSPPARTSLVTPRCSVWRPAGAARTDLWRHPRRSLREIASRSVGGAGPGIHPLK